MPTSTPLMSTMCLPCPAAASSSTALLRTPTRYLSLELSALSFTSSAGSSTSAAPRFIAWSSSASPSISPSAASALAWSASSAEAICNRTFRPRPRVEGSRKSRYNSVRRSYTIPSSTGLLLLLGHPVDEGGDGEAPQGDRGGLQVELEELLLAHRRQAGQGPPAVRHGARAQHRVRVPAQRNIYKLNK